MVVKTSSDEITVHKFTIDQNEHGFYNSMWGRIETASATIVHATQILAHMN